MNALATAPGVIATPGKYYIGAKEVMEYLDCKDLKEALMNYPQHGVEAIEEII